MTETHESLVSQARYFHQAFFKFDIEQEVIDRYVAANRHCLPEVDARSQTLAGVIVSKQLDVEAIEHVLRRTGRDAVLTKKINILFYLVEVRSRYFPLFVSAGDGRVRALLRLGLSAAATPYKFAKGQYLLWKHGLL